jgi:hypothetical protein
MTNRTSVNARHRNAAAKAVNDAIKAVFKGAKDDQLTAAKLTELMKLIHMQKELTVEQPRAINVRWIESWESQPSSEE